MSRYEILLAEVVLDIGIGRHQPDRNLGRRRQRRRSGLNACIPEKTRAVSGISGAGVKPANRWLFLTGM